MSNKPRHWHAVEDKENIPPDSNPIDYPQNQREEVKNTYVKQELLQKNLIKQERDLKTLQIAERDGIIQDRNRLKLKELPKPKIKPSEKQAKEDDKVADELSRLLNEKAKIFDEFDNFELAVEEPKKKKNNLLNSSRPQPIHSKLIKQVEIFEANIKIPEKELLTKKNEEFIAKMKLNTSQGMKQ